MGNKINIKTDQAECCVIIDKREQLPWNLEPLTCQAGTLQTGDYSLLDFPNEISIERKELSDFVGCVGGGRERFERELERLKAYRVHAVIVEASWQDLAEGNWRSKLTSQTVLRSLSSWLSQGNVIIPAGNREMSERIARSMLWFAFKHKIEPVKRVIKRRLTKGV